MDLGIYELDESRSNEVDQICGKSAVDMREGNLGSFEASVASVSYTVCLLAPNWHRANICNDNNNTDDTLCNGRGTIILYEECSGGKTDRQCGGR